VSLEVSGTPIMTLGDFTMLVDGLSDDARPLGTLAAWRNFEDVDPQELHNQLHITCRSYAKPGADGDNARAIIDNACERLERLPGVLVA
jgi:hypothetical protein